MSTAHRATIAIFLLADFAAAYSSSLADCETFAALWSATCGGTSGDGDNAAFYTENDWETTGAGASVINCATGDVDVKVNEPNTGNEVTNYSLFARNCMTCREDGANDNKVLIRYQSNNMPGFCYGNKEYATTYPSTGKFDVEMTWNPNVLNLQNVNDSSAADEAATTALLCDASFTTTLPATSTKTDHSTSDLDPIVGFSMANLLIMPGVVAG